MPHPVDMHVGKRLRQRRTLLGMSQDNLAREVNITFQQVQKYERGSNRIGASRLFEFSRILGVSTDYFFEGFDAANDSGQPGMAESQAAFAHDNSMATRETLEMVRAYYRIENDRVRGAVADMIRSVADNCTFEKE